MAEEKEVVKKEKKRGKGKWIALVVIALIVGAVVTFPRHWGPWLARTIVLWILPSGEEYKNELNIEYVGFTETKITNAVFGGLPTCPAFEYASVKYSIPGLIGKTIDSVAVSGVTIKPEYKVENFSMPSGKQAGPIVVADDPLQGWKIYSAVLKTKEIDFRPLIPEEAPFISRRATIFCDLKLLAGVYRIKGEGRFCENQFECDLTYDQAERKGKAKATVFPKLRTKTPGKTGSVDLMADYSVTSTNGYGITANAEVTVQHSPLKVYAEMEAGIKGMKLVLTQPEVSLTEQDPLVITGIGMAKIPANVQNISATAKFFSSGRVDVIPGMEPKWAFRTSVSDASGKAKVDDFDVAVKGVKTKFSISGIGPHFDITPFIVWYTNATAKSFVLDRGYATFMLDQKSLMISEAKLGFCGGNIRLYALYFSLEKLFSGFTIFVDKLDVGQLFNMLPDTKGSATGYLYGRIPMFVRSNREVYLDNAFIYSPPGDTGNISLKDTEFIREYCNSIGIPASESENLAKAFKNLDYSILRFDMIQPRDEKGQVKILVKGESPQGKVKIPVNLDITINAPVQTLINYGLNPKSLLK